MAAVICGRGRARVDKKWSEVKVLETKMNHIYGTYSIYTPIGGTLIMSK